MEFSAILSNIDYMNKSKKKYNEEETKMYLIYPFLEYLGYSVFSPLDVIFEYVCDMHESGNRRVDCAIVENNKPIIIIEAKPYGEQLNNHWGQLKSYFISSGAKFAILSNGITYHIFENDQINSKFLTCLPKHELTLNRLTEEDYTILLQLSKINLKPAIISSDSNDRSFSYTNEEKGFNCFCKITPKNDIVNSQTSIIYDKYLNFCEDNNFLAYSKIAFSKKVNKHYSTITVSKRIGREIQRVYK